MPGVMGLERGSHGVEIFVIAEALIRQMPQESIRHRQENSEGRIIYLVC